ncbi:hypothetical protein UNPF46_11565 [Bradyrhizobium sp. UNPF46]|uniref:hypothetical protein n=1 Tax=Bradyrhizobium sp. UNPF46 TaxID=1141168 RepID=UPI001172E11E|nr:hypothetical protein [Bradyrhizobium sp. UNPF46]TQF40094.1 hypothetical protein UNPF46_11565 [Bradyrhizobium sp. UNPF46]
MSPVTSSRFLVKCFDYEEWAIVVEATSREDAIRKAEAIYLTDSLGIMGSFELLSRDVGWSARRLVQDVQS